MFIYNIEKLKMSKLALLTNINKRCGYIVKSQ